MKKNIGKIEKKNEQASPLKKELVVFKKEDKQEEKPSMVLDEFGAYSCLTHNEKKSKK